MNTRHITSGAVLAVAVALAACGGGGTGSSTPVAGNLPATGPTAAAQNSAKASVSIAIPAKPTTANSNTRSPQYISASTQSMTFALASGTQLASFDLTPTSPGCAAVTGGGTQCSETFGAPAGTNTFVVTAYDQTGGKGNVLSSATMQAVLAAGSNNTIPLVLNGNATAATVILGASSLPVGTSGSTSVAIQATDAQNNIIVGPGAFANPVTLAITGDTWSTLALSSTTIAKPGQVLTLAYNGNSLVGAQIAPSASGLTGTAATFAGSGYAVSNFVLGTVSTVIPRSVAPLPGGGVAFTWRNGCCGDTAVGVSDNAGNATLLIGDTSDPLAASPAPNPTPTMNLGAPVAYVAGMIDNIDSEYGEAYADVAVGQFGTIYAGGNFSHDPLTPGASYQCNIGAIAAINPTTNALVKQTVIKGEPYQLKADSTGAIWFTEWSGQASLETDNGSGGVNYGPYTPLLSGNGTTSEYALGKLNSDGTVAFEIPFSKLGIPTTTDQYPSDFTVSADGTAVYISEYYAHAIVKVAVSGGTPTLSSGQFATLPNGTDESESIAAGSDGSLFFQLDYEPNSNYYFDYMPGTATFGTAAIATPYAFSPAEGTYSYSVAAGDGSYWFADDENAGVGRFSGFGSSGLPAQAYIATQPAIQSGYYNCGIGVGFGAAWVGQCDDGSLVRIVYGAPGSGAAQASSAVRILSAARVGASTSRRPASHKNGPRGKSKHRLPKSPMTDRYTPAQKMLLQSQHKLSRT